MSLTTATPTTTTAAAATTTVTVKPAGKENEALPPRTQQSTKSLSLTNGALKRHQHHPGNTLAVSYKECLKNHAASLGGHALDGCGEFMPSPSATPTDPTSLKCAACGCHRNFHRREPEEGSPIVEHQPPPPPPPPLRGRSPNSASPPPLSSSYYPSAPHMLLALSGGLSGLSNNHPTVKTTTQPATTSTMIASRNGRKRFRTKFSPEQKEKMHSFSESLGWKMQKKDEHLVEEFCNEVGVEKGVLKVWMHNNKNTFAKRDVGSSRSSIDTGNHHQNNNSIDHNNEDHNNDVSAQVTTNGSSSSS